MRKQRGKYMQTINKKAQFDSIKIIVFFIIIAGILIYLIYNVAYVLSQGDDQLTVKEKWVKYQGRDAKYLVSSTAGEVYEISDSWIFWRWNSSDLYAYLEPGMNCKIHYQGFRFPFMSDYKNILKVECTK